MEKATRTSDRAEAWISQVQDDHVTLGELAGALGERGFGFLLLALTLPNILVIPSVPILPFIPGVPAMVLCGQMVIGRQSPRLPSWAAALRMRKDRASRCVRWASWLSGMARARPMFAWMTGPLASRIVGAIAIVLTLLLCLPFPGLNILPGLGVLLLAVGLAEADGLIIAFGCLMGTVGAVIWGMAAWGVASAVAGA